MMSPAYRRGSKVSWSQHICWQSTKYRFLDASERPEPLVVCPPGGQIDTCTPRLSERAGKGKLEAWKVPNWLQVAQGGWRCVPQDLTDDCRNRVAVGDAQEAACQTGREPSDRRDGDAVPTGSCGLEPRVVGSHAAMNDYGLAVQHATATYHEFGSGSQTGLRPIMASAHKQSGPAILRLCPAL